MRNRIWTELAQAKHNIEFATLYADRQRLVLRWFNIAILVFSTGGIMGWAIWKDFPLLSCIIISIISLVRLVQPHIIMSDKQLVSLDSINKFYFDYYNKLEKLWYDFDKDTLKEEEAKTRFFEIKELEANINNIVNETIRSKPKSLVKKANKYSTDYFKQLFNT